MRKAGEFIGIHNSYLAKSIKKNKIYLGREFLVYISFTYLGQIHNSEVYKVAKENKKKSKVI